MDNHRKYTVEELQKVSYRFLQQLAKSLSLPSNVKKIYLIELIHAKTNKTPEEVETIVQKVKWERKKVTLSNEKKKYLQAMEVSSTNNADMSPPIDFTPKRPSQIAYESDQSFIRYPTHLKNTSDRVLRSYNVKSYKKPNYSLLNDPTMDMIEASEADLIPIPALSIENDKRKYPNMKMTARNLLNRFRPNILSGMSCLRNRDDSMPVLTDSTPMLISEKRSNFMKTIRLPERPQHTNIIQSIGFRRTDGKIAKINAVVQKQTPKSFKLRTYEPPRPKSTCKNVEVTVQDIINSNIGQTLTEPNVDYNNTVSESNPNYMNRSVLTEVMNEGTSVTRNDNGMSSYALFYDKRAPEATEGCLVLPWNSVNKQALPKINDVFNKFNNFRDVTQPLYVQVSEESGETKNCPTTAGKSNWALESMYNLRNDAMKNLPLLQIAPKADTKCVYSTPLISTPMQQCGTVPNDSFQAFSAEQNPYVNYNLVRECTSDEVSQMRGLLSSEQDRTLRTYQEGRNTAVRDCCFTADINKTVVLPQSNPARGPTIYKNSTKMADPSLESFNLCTEVNIPKLVEDALEIISRDGDYLERLGMDIRMQCILCSWVGPKFVLECHVRDEHLSQITTQHKDDWIITYKLGSLVNQDVWISQVSERESCLYILSVKYEDPNCFMASLSTLSTAPEIKTKTGTITIYNKVTGKPFLWQGSVEELSTNMPYKNSPNCLKLDLSKLELLPNSANLKLHNRSFVLDSPSNVVVGQPELNDIHIIVFVNIQDS